MTMNKHFYLFCIAASTLLLPSCVEYRELLSYHEAPGIPTTPQPILNYNPIVIEPNDILSVQVSSSVPEAAAPFNSGGAGGGFLVDANGEIFLPTLGPIKVDNLTLEAAKETLQKALQPYFLEQPIVNVRLLNFKINVNGEVGRPGIFPSGNSRMTIVEAMTLAGDFTPYSRRDSILIIREINNERIFGYLDFTSSELFNSPYFYLKQNDVIYVQPKKEKAATVRDTASRAIPYISIATGLTALILTLVRTF